MRRYLAYWILMAYTPKQSFVTPPINFPLTSRPHSQMKKGVKFFKKESRCSGECWLVGLSVEEAIV